MFSKIFGVFSKRREHLEFQHVVPESTRVRVVMFCQELFSNQHSAAYSSHGNYTGEFLEENHRSFRYRHGRMLLSEARVRTPQEDTLEFLMACKGEEFLDFLEEVFQVGCWCRIAYSPDRAVDDINSLLRQDSLPYYLTGFVRETGREVAKGGPFAGEEHEFTKVIATPKIIMRESEVLHIRAIQPALELLRRPEFFTANKEYMAALEDYRKDDFGDCLTKCCSAFESVLKIICTRKKWPYSQNDPAGPLVKKFLEYAKLDKFFDPMLMTPAVLRNKLSASHGAGIQTKQVSRHVAMYALNTTASAIIFVTQEVELF